MTKNNILKAEGLVKSYKNRRVVDNVNISISQGEVVGLLGPNGAGKTTTFYMIVGLVTLDQGRMFIGDDDITACPMYLRARKGISYLPQESSVFRKLTVEENILAILETLNLNKSERQQKKNELLEEMGILHLAKSKAYNLSGGECRRLEIARSLVIYPRFVLLDEPFAGVDPKAVIDIQKIIARLKEKGIGILITDHNVRETLEITDRSYIINKGSILLSGSSLDLVNSKEAREVYLGETFRM
ncbi:MAG: LPS export ABC transporter ATP-binding protein [bacterium]